ncbi:MAG: hypothetical protein GWM87_14880 [Xanthomonadales bacterium]|nr:hypothetical protein [Xanthomonadales bacterium]NIX14079.1 hypothetical protein [Xanthomonadales bacterium]
MKRILIVLLGLSVATASWAAEGEKGPGKGKRGGPDRMARMQEHLGLSDEQVEQIREIRENGGTREDFEGVLTEEQRELMRERRSEMQGERRGGRGKGKGKGKGKGQGEGKGPKPGGESAEG